MPPRQLTSISGWRTRCFRLDDCGPALGWQLKSYWPQNRHHLHLWKKLVECLKSSLVKIRLLLDVKKARRFL
jgi:hypothetical protein